MRKDFQITNEGDIAIVSEEVYDDVAQVYRTYRKAGSVSKDSSMMQTVKIRLMSSDPDVKDINTKGFCANLEDLLGMANTEETARLGIEKITKSLTFDGLVKNDQLYIRPTPTREDEIKFYILIRTEGDTVLGFEVFLNLEGGVRMGRIIDDSIS